MIKEYTQVKFKKGLRQKKTEERDTGNEDTGHASSQSSRSTYTVHLLLTHSRKNKIK